MSGLWEVPISSVISLTPERAVAIIRAIFRAECRYAKLGPSALTISDRLMTPDGGIDAQVNTIQGRTVPVDCIFQAGLTGFQIKSGVNFKPWTSSAIKVELLNSKGDLYPEVKRLIDQNGHYTVICTGHDLTPQQRNKSEGMIAGILTQKGFKDYAGKIEVLGASQIAEFAERYSSTASLLAADPIQDALTLEEWGYDSHMTNAYKESPEQIKIISQIRASLQGEAKHIRILGEAGLGKTRIVLESLKDKAISPYVLYIQHGSQFGQTNLFRRLLRSGHDKPLILVIDELPENELSDIWRHLKPRCGHLKVISMDHGLDNSYDAEIERLTVPYLPDETIKKILAHRVGESRELDRWVRVCEGSPRVAQAVADNLCANPTDLLKPPATIPIWARFIHGYGKHDATSARQIDCVSQHLALFSRFGYEAPVGEEADYIAGLIQQIDPTIGIGRFHEILKDLRSRRVLQGSRTLFFVPKALHIYLWRQFWDSYGRSFDFVRTFNSMPPSLHTWFMSMFKYAGQASADHVVREALNLDGLFSQKEALMSAKGAQFLSILAEANQAAVLRLLEATLGKWTNQELLALKENRQILVWTLEKLAVWQDYTVRAMQLLIRLAVNENAQNSNNSKGTLLGLFHIGPESAATESTPEARFPIFLRLLRSQGDDERCLGLEVAEASLKTRRMRSRVVGPEYQGLRERAKLWMPETYDEWWQAQLTYFQALVSETKDWPSHLRPEVCDALLSAVEQQIKIPPCTDLAFSVLDDLMKDKAMPPKKLNNFFWRWKEYDNDVKFTEIKKRLHVLECRYTKRDLASRFNRYVLDVDWRELEEERRELKGTTRSRAKLLIKALANRIARSPEKINEIVGLLTPQRHTQGLYFFGEQLANSDLDGVFLPQLIEITLADKNHTCLHGYLSELRKYNKHIYINTINDLLDSEFSAWLGAHIALMSEYDDHIFVKCLEGLGKGWIAPQQFGSLQYGRVVDQVPKERLETLFQQLNSWQSEETACFLVELLDTIQFSDDSPFDPPFVFGVVSRHVPRDQGSSMMDGYHWKNVSQKLIQWDKIFVLPLLDVLLTKMGESYYLSYHSDVASIANELVQKDPSGAWGGIKMHFEAALPEWRFDILDWLKGGVGAFDEKESRFPIADLPYQEIFEWIDESPELRAGLIAHAAPKTLDDIDGGKLTRDLIHKYGQFDGVKSGISANFHSGGWTGPASAYLKRKREKFRRWLAAGFDLEITQWIESEIEYLDRCIESEEINEERSKFD